MKKKMVLVFCGGFLIAVIVGMLAKTPIVLEGDSPQPLMGLISGVLNGIQFGLVIPLVAWLLKQQKQQEPYFVLTFAVTCGLAAGEGVILGTQGLLLLGLLFAVSKIAVLCVIYVFTCRWWKKQSV